MKFQMKRKLWKKNQQAGKIDQPVGLAAYFLIDYGHLPDDLGSCFVTFPDDDLPFFMVK